MVDWMQRFPALSRFLLPNEQPQAAAPAASPARPEPQGAWRIPAEQLNFSAEARARIDQLQASLQTQLKGLVEEAEGLISHWSPTPPAPEPKAENPSGPKPEKPAEPKPAPQPAGRTHTVGPGDSLYSLAARYLGDGERWREIFEANRDQVQNPDLIIDGTVLRIPGGEAAPAPKPAAKPSALSGTASKEGRALPDTFGRATTFWNGNYVYKGQRDRENMSIGAWGDPHRPEQYFCALPVGLNGESGSQWWHNQKILITNPSNGKQVVVLVQDKGPGPGTGNKIDLSPVAKEALGVDFMDNLNVAIAFAPEDAAVGPV